MFQPWLTLVTLIVPGVSAWLLVRSAGPWPQRVTGFLAGAVIYMTLLLASVHLCEMLRIAGIVGSLSLSWFASFNIIVLAFLAMFALLLPRGARSAFEEITPDRPSRSRGERIAHRIGLAILGGCWAIFAVSLLSGYPGGWDAVSYHLPVAVRWLQGRSLATPPSHPFEYSYPGNAEIGMMLWLGTGWQAAALFFNILAGVLTLAATFSLADRFSGDAGGATLSTMVLASIPIVLFQSFTGYADLFGTSFLLAGLCLFLRRNEPPGHLTPARWYAIAVALAGCSWGIAVGTKLVDDAYAAVFLLGAGITLWVEADRAWRAAAAKVVLLLAGVLIPSAIWFLRGIVETGNPVYPLRVEIFGHTLLDGLSAGEINDPDSDLMWVRTRAEWLVYPWVEYKLSGYNYSEGAGLGAAWATFIPLGILYAIFDLARGRQLRGFAERSALMVAFVALALLWWFALHRMPRFGLPLFPLACVFSAPMFALLRRSDSAVFRCLFIASLGVTCLLSAYDPLHDLQGRVRLKRWDRPFAYGYPPEIDALPGGSSILDMRKERTPSGYNKFGLAGRDLANRVIHREWLGAPLSDEALRAWKIDYIYDTHPFSSEPPRLSGVRLVVEGAFDPDSTQLWRLYDVVRDAEAARSNPPSNAAGVAPPSGFPTPGGEYTTTRSPLRTTRASVSRL